MPEIVTSTGPFTPVTIKVLERVARPVDEAGQTQGPTSTRLTALLVKLVALASPVALANGTVAVAKAKPVLVAVLVSSIRPPEF